ncbi:MAG: helix-turn-helix transcriptional regulator [Nitrospirae bacterium]|nr:helix-turn-helix transcriptional regulator [Nitrospirota bacterium]
MIFGSENSKNGLNLEKEGIVARKIFPEVPPRVEYALTKRGKSLGAIIESMRIWGEKNNVK